MAYIRFSSAGSVMQFSSHITYPLSKPTQSSQVLSRTNSGETQVEELGYPPIKKIVLQFDRMNIGDRSNLEFWINNTINWAAETFVYLDERGQEWIARLLNQTFDFKEIEHQIYQGTLELENLGSEEVGG